MTSCASPRSQDILCQGRGSAANSALCFCLGITEVDPARHELLFERFISAERGEPPDIDVDFEHERREEVMQYIYNRYGRARAGLTATVITYRSRSALRDVGKAFGLSEDVIAALSSTLWGGASEGSQDNEIRRLGLDPRRGAAGTGAGAGARNLTAFRAIFRSIPAASSSPARGSTKPCRSPMPRWTSAPRSNGTRTISTRSAF